MALVKSVEVTWRVELGWITDDYVDVRIVRSLEEARALAPSDLNTDGTIRITRIERTCHLAPTVIRNGRQQYRAQRTTIEEVAERAYG